MTIDGHHVFFDDKFTQQPNHARVARLLRELDCQVHAERRSTRIYITRNRHTEQPLLAHWAQALRQAFQ